ncbi:Hypothetical protein R9X50_00570400 [Acrodontium crateriforme]|uniref:Oxidoreductase-like domain-containing protein n=1 Tax=Acrodontium crateriforme TaxID=150365 RepID=A0AAQ3RB46_9PEZI|nr:Hypothetical protein R9X50_00570400 [Acrodontium crateriforme]
MRPAFRVCAKAYQISPRWVNHTAVQVVTCSQRSASSVSDYKHAFEGYTADLLDAPILEALPGAKPERMNVAMEEPSMTEEEERIAKARVVFGSRPGQWNVDRREEIERRSTLIAGVSVPPKPEEPDNCCMSGCVNCVWDLFRDDVEEWAAKSAEAKKKMTKLQEQRSNSEATPMSLKEPKIPGHATKSMEDESGGSETRWSTISEGGSAVQGQEDELFAGIPVAIREFMKTEKKLKEKHRKERVQDSLEP